MTMYLGLRTELLDTLERAQAAATPMRNGRSRWSLATLASVVLLAGVGVATGSTLVSWTPSDGERPATNDVAPELRDAFTLLRERPVTPITGEAAGALGANGGFRGKNIGLARSFSSPVTDAWAIPAADGTLCVGAALPGVEHPMYGMSCSSLRDALAKGVQLAFEKSDGSAYRAVLVPDGARVRLAGAHGSSEVETVFGAAVVHTGPGERIEIDGR